jgi:hypothetical protein
MHTRITAIVKNASAKLNTGKFPTAIKSLTPPKNTLSHKFPNVPAKKSPYSHIVNIRLQNKTLKSTTHTKEIPNTIPIGIAIHREIPVLKSGSKNKKSAQTS